MTHLMFHRQTVTAIEAREERTRNRMRAGLVFVACVSVACIAIYWAISVFEPWIAMIERLPVR